MRVAVCQMNAGEDVAANVEVAVGLLRQAAEGGADLAALPEYFGFLGASARRAEVAEPIPGPVSDRLAETARGAGMWVLGGGLLERDGSHVHDTAALFDRAGEMVARYRKIHLYDAELPGQRPIRESALFAAGDEVVTRDVDGLRLGMSICYDVRFPELYRGLMTSGAVILAVPSAFQAVTGAAPWETLLRARAIEEQSYVLAAAQWGPWGAPEAGHRTFGNAMVVDPWGSIVVRAPDEGDGVWFADIDADEVRSVRTRLPALSHRRLGNAC